MHGSWNGATNSRWGTLKTCKTARQEALKLLHDIQSCQWFATCAMTRLLLTLQLTLSCMHDADRLLLGVPVVVPPMLAWGPWGAPASPLPASTSVDSPLLQSWGKQGGLCPTPGHPRNPMLVPAPPLGTGSSPGAAGNAPAPKFAAVPGPGLAPNPRSGPSSSASSNRSYAPRGMSLNGMGPQLPPDAWAEWLPAGCMCVVGGLVSTVCRLLVRIPFHCDSHMVSMFRC